MIKEFTKGIIRENPLFVIVLGLCPTLAISTEVINAVGMGAGVIFVLVGSNCFISMLRKVIPDSIRIPAYIVIIATFVTIVEMFMEAFTPGLYKNLGIFVSLIVVNCIILGRAEAFASKNTVGKSVLDGLGMGIGFTMSLLLIATIREVTGAGSITLFPMPSIGFSGKIIVPGLSIYPARVMVYAAGALLLMGYLKGFFAWMEYRQAKASKKDKAVELMPIEPAGGAQA
jgi:Na+-translocating ferredoxin:NAD+ oxidoreductase subunit E